MLKSISNIVEGHCPICRFSDATAPVRFGSRLDDAGTIGGPIHSCGQEQYDYTYILIGLSSLALDAVGLLDGIEHHR